MTFNRITTAGAGTMGSQVAWQMVLHGKDVISESRLRPVRLHLNIESNDHDREESMK
jgi:3-hydroxyacyl-CoA dehydrogenase